MQVEENVEYILSKDADGKALAGEKNYRVHLPPNIPAQEYWSLLVYDNQTNLIISNNQPWPSVFSTSKRLVVNQDGSIDVRFGPKQLTGKKCNWIQTIPRKEWTMVLKLYGALESWYDQTWRPGEIEQN